MSDGPRIRVGAFLLLGDHIVTVRHRKDGASYHLLPGGGVEAGETLASALVREVFEETGLRIACERPLIINDTIVPQGERHLVNITFEARILGGELAEHPSDPRVEAVDLVEPGELRSLDLRPPIADILLEALASGEAFHTTYVGNLLIP